MIRKPVIAVWVKPAQLAQMEALAASERRSNAAALRLMLEDYMNGNLIPTPINKPKDDRKMVSATVDEAFKTALEARIANEGTNLASLVDQLLATKTTQGAAK